MQQVSHPSGFWACFGNSTSQGLVPVGSMSEDTVLGGGKKYSAYVDVNCAVQSFGLRATEQAQPILFGSIGIAIDVFN